MPSDAPERLFRDPAGAALERVAHLEDENRRLREQVEQLSSGQLPGKPGPVSLDFASRPAPPGPLPAIVAALVAGTLMLGGLLTTFGARCSRHHRRASVPAYLHSNGADCAIPYLADRDGRLRPNPECAAREEAFGSRPTRERDCSPPWEMRDGRRHYKRACIAGADVASPNGTPPGGSDDPPGARR